MKNTSYSGTNNQNMTYFLTPFLHIMFLKIPFYQTNLKKEPHSLTWLAWDFAIDFSAAWKRLSKPLSLKKNTNLVNRRA